MNFEDHRPSGLTEEMDWSWGAFDSRAEVDADWRPRGWRATLEKVPSGRDEESRGLSGCVLPVEAVPSRASDSSPLDAPEGMTTPHWSDSAERAVSRSGRPAGCNEPRRAHLPEEL